MDTKALGEWLIQPRTELIQAVTHCLREHVHALRSQGINFYGYALLPGDPYDISSVVAAYNSESDIKVPKDDELYRYHYFSVDEWAHYERDKFEPVRHELAALNSEFAGLHQKGGDDFEMNEFEVSHARSLLESMLQGIEAAKTEGVFGKPDPFLAIWIPDSSETIMAESVRRLNPPSVAREFMADFG